MSRSSDPENPLLGYTLFPNVKFTPDPSNPYDFDRELQAIDLHLRSTTASLPGLREQAKNIISGTVPESEISQALKRLIEQVPGNAVESYRERRPALSRQKRARFSLKPDFSQPDISLRATFDSKKYKDPEEYFTNYERNENAKRELENQMGGAILDGDNQNPSQITRGRRPGIPRRSVKYKHRISALESEIIESVISTQETFETSIFSPQKHSSYNESQESQSQERGEMDLPGSKVKDDNSRNNEILDGLLSQPTEELEGDGAVRLVKESLHIKNFELEDICLQEFPDIQIPDLKSSRRTLPNSRQTPQKSPLASLSVLSKRSSLSLASKDPFSAFDIDRVPETNPSSVENRSQQSDVIDIAEKKMVSDELRSPLIKQNDKIESAKTGSCAVAINEFNNASKRSKRKSLIRPGVSYDVDMEEEIGGSKVMSETISMPEDDTDTLANGVNYSDKVEEKLQEADPEVNAADSTLEKFNGAEGQVADDVIYRDNIREEDSTHKAVLDHNVVDSTVENLDALGQLDQSHSTPVEEHPTDQSHSRNPDVGLEKQNEIMQKHSGVSLDKPTEANSRSRKTQKKKEVSKRQSLAGHGTIWKSGVRRSTRIRTRPLEYWKGERLLIGRIHNSLPTVIGMKYASPGKGEGDGSLKVKSFVSEKHKMLVDLVSYH